MGLLDDAIREHLELKRQHGGDPSEIERQENEAFGAAARREEDEAAAAAAATDTGEHVFDDEAEAAAPDVGPATEEHPPPDAPGPEDFAADAPTTAYTPAEREDATAPDEMEPPAGEEEVPSAGHEADAPGYDEDPWLDEPEPEQERPAPASQEDDVLEETPEFLQETPEHDRLWFEQKPPRGFDWDR
ncbi:MAG TPA: hypothetical protein VH276_14425 [Solirubrobacteraceae bacterium]|nr:hypothetical protein [Solirubrobacteraceae bacterium]